MDMWRGSIHLFDGSTEDFISEKALVREWLSERIKCASAGFIWEKKDVHNVEELKDWEHEEIVYMFYRGFAEKIIWEDWSISKRQLTLW